MRSPKQGRAKLILEPLDPGRERRLTDRERVRRASHVPLPCDLDKPFDLGEELTADVRAVVPLAVEAALRLCGNLTDA